MKKCKSWVIAILTLALCLLVFVGCSAAEHDWAESPDEGAGSHGVVAENVNRKLTYSVSIDLRTKELDKATTDISEKTRALGGYVAEQDISDDSCYLTVRIPTEKLDEFLQSADKNGKVQSKNIRIVDITGQYVDATSQKSALEARKASLQALLDTEGVTVSDKLTVLKEISELDTQLQFIEQLISQYDSQTDYSTVYFRIYSNSFEFFPIVIAVFGVVVFAGLVIAVVLLACRLYEERRKSEKLAEKKD